MSNGNPPPPPPPAAMSNQSLHSAGDQPVFNKVGEITRGGQNLLPFIGKCFTLSLVKLWLVIFVCFGSYSGLGFEYGLLVMITLLLHNYYSVLKSPAYSMMNLNMFVINFYVDLQT